MTLLSGYRPRPRWPRPQLKIFLFDESQIHAGKIEGVIKSVDSAIKELKDVIGKLKNEGTVPTDEEADELITSVKKAVGDLQVLIGDGD